MNEDSIEIVTEQGLADELSQELGTPVEREIPLPPFEPSSNEVIAVTGKQYLRNMRAHIRRHHDRGASGRSVEQAFARALDNVLRATFDEAVAEASKKRKTAPRIALLGVGGYGRGELAPFSDVDILFLFGGREQAAAKKISEQVLYVLWDLGLDVGYSVRTVTDCVKFAEEDDTVRTAMLDARLICGNEGLWEEFDRELLKKALLKRSDRYLTLKIEKLEQRHAKYGESVYILEPNVKEGLGGFRDFQTILWAGRVKFHVRDVSELHQLGFLTRQELAQFNRYYDFLLRVRHELHFQFGAKNDRLAFDLQSKIAPGLGFSKEKSATRAAERFMRRYYLVTRAGAELTRRILDRMVHYGGVRTRFPKFWGRPKDVGDGFVLASGELTVGDPKLFEREPHKMVEIFEKAQALDVDLSKRSRDLIYQYRHKASRGFHKNSQALASFRRILQGGRRVSRTLWLMHELRLLNKLIPEFRTITCHVQHDAYHLHTTDVHTLFAMRELRRLMKGQIELPTPLAGVLAQQVERPHVLYLGLFCHDIGKNMGGNHSEKGAKRARNICERLALPEEDVADVEWLVRYHLLLSHIALKRDLNDPRQISAFASQVGSEGRLDMLYLLTTADMRAVGPDIWTPWKGQLLDQAHQMTKYALEHGRIEAADLEQIVKERTRQVLKELKGRYDEVLVREELSLFPERYFLTNSSERIRAHLDLIFTHAAESGGRKAFSEKPVRLARHPVEGTPYSEIVLYSLDVPGFFSRTTGVLASHGLSILSAEITTLQDGTLVDTFHVADPHGRFAAEPDRWERVERDLGAVLQGRVQVDQLLSRSGTPLSIARFSPSYPTRISFDNESSRNHTIIDVTTGDRIGLLYSITSALSRMGLTIYLAKVSTKKERADDTFYVTDIFGAKVIERHKLRQIEGALREAIGGTALKAGSLGGGSPATVAG